MKPKSTENIQLSISKTKHKHNLDGITNILHNKNIIIQDIIRNTILSINRNKTNEIFSNNDSMLSISILTNLYSKTNTINNQLSDIQNNKTDEIIESLQQVIDKLSVIICGFGTNYISDVLFISFGTEFKNTPAPTTILQSKYNLIQKYVTPISYKIIQWNKKKVHTHKNIICENKITEDDILCSPSGVRAQAMSTEGELLMDFKIEKKENQVHILNAPSPGATASLAIANYIINNFIEK